MTSPSKYLENNMKVRELSEALRKKAEEDINENDHNIATNLEVMKNYYNEHFEEQTIQPLDQWLLAFLRGCKHDVEKGKRKLEKYYTLKKAAPDFFANRNPSDDKAQTLLNLGLFLPLQKLAKEDSPRTCLVRVSQLSNSGYSLVDLIKIGFMIAEILLLEDDNFTVVGEEIVADMENVGFSILTQWTPNLVRRIFTCAQNALTVRLKSLHIINAPRGLKAAVMIFKMFLTAKMKQRIYIYNEDYEGMYEYVPRSTLPVEYGGTAGNIQDLTEYWKTKAQSYSDWFAEFDKASDEFKKPKKTKVNNSATHNNEQRNFRSLEVD